MRKRRRLANKMTIMVCAVLIAVSAFFYVPMDVRAEALFQTNAYEANFFRGNIHDTDFLYLKDYLSSDSGFFRVRMDITVDIHSDVSCKYANFFACFNSCGFFEQMSQTTIPYCTEFQFTETRTFYVDASLSRDDTIFRTYYFFNGFVESLPSNVNLDFSYNVSNVRVDKVSAIDYESYQSGYNAGYSAGEQAGESNGYSSGYSDGYEAGEQSGFDSGFQAGSDSVDTQSYYDAGYSAGYDVGYATGYDTGYDEGYDAGWSAYEEQMDKWGADTSDYPLLIQQTDGTFDLQFDFIQPARVDDVISEYCDVGRYYSGIDFNPNHTYRLDFTYHDFEYDYSDSYFTAAYSFWLYWGSCSFPITVGTKDDITSSFYISGDQIGTGLKFRCDVSGLEAYSEYFGVLHYYINDCTLKLYDMGPSGDTQNHIANQTDQLTNGYDDSKGNTVNSELSMGLNEYETAENSLFATATTGMKDFTFFDFESVPAMLTAVTFITSIMGSWFEQAGGASGVGIVLSILFSVMLVSMVLGLYRLYQSAGHRAEARERHRERMAQWKRRK